MQSPTKDTTQGLGQETGQGFGQGSGPATGQSIGQEIGNSGRMRSEIRSDAERLKNTLADRIHSELDARKGTAATQARSLSSAVGQAADGLDDGAPQWLRAAFQQGAQYAQRFADSLEQKDSRQVMSDIQDIARNNPGAFIAGCAALGFAAARILKAGAPDDSSPSQLRPAQLPPVQGEEPMFRSSGTGASNSASTPGEFV